MLFRFSKVRWAALPALTLLAIHGCSSTQLTPVKRVTSTEPVKIEEIARTYHQLTFMTKEPVFVDPVLASLCRGVNEEDVKRSREVSGPHAHTLVSVYMNDSAAIAFKTKAIVYPVGSIVVKEKKGMSYRLDGQWVPTTQTSDGVGGMIKRPPGFDPAHHDWEYFYFTDPSKVETGKIASCVQCHIAAEDRDYIFGGWAGADRVR